MLHVMNEKPINQHVTCIVAQYRNQPMEINLRSRFQCIKILIYHKTQDTRANILQSKYIIKFGPMINCNKLKWQTRVQLVPMKINTL